MIGAADLDDLLLFGKCARCADGRHDTFGPRTEHAEHLDRGHEAMDQLCQFEFILMEQTR